MIACKSFMKIIGGVFLFLFLFLFFVFVMFFSSMRVLRMSGKLKRIKDDAREREREREKVIL